MYEYPYKTLTTNGASLMAKDDADQINTKIDKMFISSSQISDPNTLSTYNIDYFSGCPSFPITSLTHNGSTFQVNSVIDNQNLSNDIPVYTIGICGHPENDASNEVLIGVAANTDKPIVIPKKSNTDFRAYIGAGFTYSNADNVTAQMTQAGLVDEDELNSRLSNYVTESDLDNRNPVVYQLSDPITVTNNGSIFDKNGEPMNFSLKAGDKYEISANSSNYIDINLLAYDIAGSLFDAGYLSLDKNSYLYKPSRNKDIKFTANKSMKCQLMIYCYKDVYKIAGQVSGETSADSTDINSLSIIDLSKADRFGGVSISEPQSDVASDSQVASLSSEMSQANSNMSNYVTNSDLDTNTNMVLHAVDDGSKRTLSNYATKDYVDKEIKSSNSSNSNNSALLSNLSSSSDYAHNIAQGIDLNRYAKNLIGSGLASNANFANAFASNANFGNSFGSNANFADAFASNANFGNNFASNYNFANHFASNSNFTNSLASNNQFIQALAPHMSNLLIAGDNLYTDVSPNGTKRVNLATVQPCTFIDYRGEYGDPRLTGYDNSDSGHLNADSNIHYNYAMFIVSPIVNNSVRFLWVLSDKEIGSIIIYLSSDKKHWYVRLKNVADLKNDNY